MREKKRGVKMSSIDALLYFFDLKETELCIYKDLLREGPATAKVLGERLGKDRTPAYTGVMRLVKCGLVKRSVKKKDEGGIYYTYDAVEPERVQDLLMDRIDEWHTTVTSSVGRLSSDLRKGA